MIQMASAGNQAVYEILDNLEFMLISNDLQLYLQVLSIVEYIYIHGFGHKTVAVLLPGFAINW